MSWVCANCSTCNPDEEARCMVCEMERPSEPVRSETAEGRKGLSAFAVIRGNVKGFFGKLLGKRPPSEKKPKEPKRISEAKPKKTSGGVPLKRGKGDRSSDFAPPWPEHRIAFDRDAIRGRGYTRSERAELNGVKGYRFYKSDDLGQFIKAETLVMLHMANKIE